MNILIEYGNDLKDDAFRVSLICTLLETVKPYLK
jgi:hypothetical protein